MEKNKEIKISKFLSYVLRHRPEKIGLNIDKNGWTDVGELLGKLENTTFDELCEVVRNSDKQRFKFNDDKTKIKANQGHSIKVDLGLTPIMPPDKLYHGTAERFLSLIEKEGLKKMNRHHVHLYGEKNMEKALATGQRHQKRGNAVVLAISTREMYKKGIEFFKTDNNVYLTDFVHRKYITKNN